MEAAGAWERIREAQPMQNMNHNLIQTLSEKLDGVARYSLYEDDARGQCEHCVQLLERIKRDDEQHVQMLRDEIAKHVQSDAWR